MTKRSGVPIHASTPTGEAAIIKPALCLDFDGTIRYSKSGKKFVQSPEDVALFEGVEDKVWSYKDEGYLIFGITNQGGVAYGIRTVADVVAEIEATRRAFRRGDPFDLIQVCTFHEGGKSHTFGHRSLLRKPNIGMLVACEIGMFKEGIVIDWDSSLFVGDRPEDEECARRAGIAFIDAEAWRSG